MTTFLQKGAILDDDRELAEATRDWLSSPPDLAVRNVIELFHSPDYFLSRAKCFDHWDWVLFDGHFRSANTTGIEVARQMLELRNHPMHGQSESSVFRPRIYFYSADSALLSRARTLRIFDKTWEKPPPFDEMRATIVKF